MPGPKPAYQLRLQDKGTETVIAVCNASKEEVDGIQHNFDEKQFTELGDYRSFTRTITVEGQEEGRREEGERRGRRDRKR